MEQENLEVDLSDESEIFKKEITEIYEPNELKIIIECSGLNLLNY